MNKLLPHMPDEILELIEKYVGPYRIYRGDIIPMINKLTDEYEKIDLYYHNRNQIRKWRKAYPGSNVWCYSILKNDRIKPPPGTGLYEENPLLGKQWRRFNWYYNEKKNTMGFAYIRKKIRWTKKDPLKKNMNLSFTIYN